MKEVNSQNLWTLESGTQEGISLPIYIIVWQNDQNLNNDSFYRPPVTSAQCIFSTKKYPDSASLLSYDDDFYSQGYAQIRKAFRALTKDDILQPYVSDNDVISSNDDKDNG